MYPHPNLLNSVSAKQVDTIDTEMLKQDSYTEWLIDCLSGRVSINQRAIETRVIVRHMYNSSISPTEKKTDILVIRTSEVSYPSAKIVTLYEGK